MRDIHKLCKICLNPGTRDIFDSGFTNIVSRDELNRIAEKLRFVTLLKVSPKENLPQQICDLCIVQLNVSYNFKRLALKNDFYIRQYMIENGMNLLKEDDDQPVENSIEIHQIHNVIRTSNRYRPQQAITSIPNEPFRRNSTTSSVSGISTMIVNGCENGTTTVNGNSSDNQFVHPSRPFVQPIQIKTEPVDPDEENLDNIDKTQTNQSSPSSSSSGSVLTINSSEKSQRTRAKSPPMIVINGHITNTPNNNIQKTSHPTTSSKTTTNIDKTSPKASTSVSSDKFKEKLRDKENEEPKKTKNLPKQVKSINKKTKEKPRDNSRNLRTIKKPINPIENKRKLREAAKKMVEKRNQQKKEASLKKIKKAIQMKIAKNQQKVNKKKQDGKQHKNAQKGPKESNEKNA
ncbi:uncharacterized protein DDB_G0284459-like [Chironomus tepperi]|uniref:uncharacterized protein DDB_G0284459-like n=1 Tax=Chironomus tepperi TaxID=113505 RepID=UPI00391F5B29